MFKFSTILPIAILLCAVAAFFLWPMYVTRAADATRVGALPTMAPVTKDYEYRAREIAFWEKAVKSNVNGDFISPQHLADQYLQRYREDGDIGDVMRAEAMAKRSLQAHSHKNVGAYATLATVYLTLHRFHDALAVTKYIETFDPGDPNMLIREASLDLEIGDYAGAKRIIAHLPTPGTYDVGRFILDTRYAELTGHLADARVEFQRPTAIANAQFDAPAQSRAWYFFRSGELAFEAGDNDAAIAFEAQALSVFPHDVDASRAKARFECANHRWGDCLKDATFSANIIPYPETLGYEADAQDALGHRSDAVQTRDLIRTVERVGNAQRISDRLLAIYYADHNLFADDAYAIAKRELTARDDIFTEDTLAWAAARDNRWDEARIRIAKALQFDTENSVLQYHAGVIALHFGDKDEAKRRFTRALALNANFHETFADDARAQLAKL